MYRFSNKSQRKLATCDQRIQDIFSEVIKIYDCSVLEGTRGEAEQNQLFELGLSKVQYPNSKHNLSPSQAIDVVPYPIDWNDHGRFCYFAGIVFATAARLGVRMRWGGDWDQDGTTKDERFLDMAHFELLD